jgi:hypothetical protein
MPSINLNTRDGRKEHATKLNDRGIAASGTMTTTDGRKFDWHFEYPGRIYTETEVV